MKVREDFRRDGLAANFLADGELVNIVAKVLPGSKINIGYPAICAGEYRSCEEILTTADNPVTELCVVGHARDDHLKKMSQIIEGYENVSANSWMPISDYFLAQTVRVDDETAFKGLKSIRLF
jgi:hypothetical protein